MGEPSPPSVSVEHYYRLEDEYHADMAAMEAAGWRLIAVRRAPDDTIIATYAYALTTSPLLLSPLGAPGAPQPGAPLPPYYPLSAAPRSRYVGVAMASRFFALLIILGVSVVIMSATRGAFGSLPLPACVPGSVSCAAPNAPETLDCPTATTSAAAATAAARLTATPLAADITGVALGGTDDAFDVLFGCSYGIWYDIKFHGQVVNIEIGDSQDTFDGVYRVSYIAVYWFHSSPSLATRRATIAHFFPPHTVALGANTKVSPTEYLYRSASLAAMFSPGSFVDNADEPVTPGTFSEVCDAANCTIQIGDINEGA
jgi:hypothetical protein